MVSAAVGVVEHAIDGRAGAVVLAHCLDGRRIGALGAVGAQDLLGVALVGFQAEPLRRYPEGVGVAEDQLLGQGRAGRGTTSASIRSRTRRRPATRSRRSGRCRARRAGDRRGMIERHAVRDPPSAVVPGDRERGVTELAHRGEQIAGQRSLAVRAVVVAHRRTKRLAVAGEVRDDEGEPLGQRRRDRVPHEVRLGKPVEQEQRQARPADPDVDVAPRRRDICHVEVLEQHCGRVAAHIR